MVRSSRLWLSCGVVALLLALLAALGSNPVAHRIQGAVMSGIRQQIIWQPDSPEGVAARFRGSASPDATPVFVRYRFFNITNLQQVRQGAKPVLEEVGPYTYQKQRIKRGVQFVDGGTAVRFHEYSYHCFVPQLSNGSLDDPITTLNVPLIGALEYIESLGLWKARPLLELLAGLVEQWGDPRVAGLFTTRTAEELLWGYRDSLLARLSLVLPHLDPTFRLVHNTSSPQEADAGFASQANTGLDSLADVWQCQEWEGVRAVTSWNPPHLEQVRGTDAFQFRPALHLNDSVKVWVGELYRAAKLVAREKVSMGGVPLLRLRADPGEGDPDPRFFQTIRGLMNVTAPTAAGPGGSAGKPGPPIFLSYPHYCGADPRLAAGVEGLQCRPEQHDLFLDVEPSTGITLRAAKRLMMSSWFGGKWRSIDPATRDTFLPIFWAEESSQALPQQLRQFRPMLRAQAAVRALQWYGLPAAYCLALLAVGCLCVATVLWGGGDGSSGSEAAEAAVVAEARKEDDTALAAAPPPAGSVDDASGEYEALEAGEQQDQRQPLLGSHPVTVDA